MLTQAELPSLNGHIQHFFQDRVNVKHKGTVISMLLRLTMVLALMQSDPETLVLVISTTREWSSEMKQNSHLLINQNICQRDSQFFTHNICLRDSYTSYLHTVYATEIVSSLHTLYAKEISILVLYTQYMPKRQLYQFFTHNICQRDSCTSSLHTIYAKEIAILVLYTQYMPKKQLYQFFTHIICQRDSYICSLHTIYAKEISILVLYTQYMPKRQ